MEKDLFFYFKGIMQGTYSTLESRLGKYDLVKGQAHLLILIRDNDGCTQKDLANAIGVKYSSMSERLNKLEKNGYIVRVVDDNNSKYKRIYITSEGKAAVIQSRKIVNEFENKLYKGFTKKDKINLEQYLEKMIKNIQR